MCVDTSAMPGKMIDINGRKFRLIRERSIVATQKEMAAIVGLSEPAIRKLEASDVYRMRPITFARMASRLGMTAEKAISIFGFDDRSLEEIMADSDREFQKIRKANEKWAQQVDENLDMATKVPVPDIPTFDIAVAAGQWVDVSEYAELREPGQIDDGRFRIYVRGDSMKPDWPDGSLVEFRCMRQLRDVLEIGEDYYVQVDGQGTFKRLVEMDEEILTFRAVNLRKYPKPMIVPRSEVVRMAKAEYMLVKPKQRRQ